MSTGRSTKHRFELIRVPIIAQTQNFVEAMRSSTITLLGHSHTINVDRHQLVACAKARMVVVVRALQARTLRPRT
jgi:hypothetical protein